MKTKITVRRRARRPGLPGDLSHAPAGGARWLVAIVASAAFLLMLLNSASAQEVRDLVEVEGAGPNYLRGAGLVIGLNGNGDSAKGETLTLLKNLLGNEFRRQIGDISSKNVALVTVTAVLPPFAKPGTAIDVRVQAAGDAKSLAGGTLFLTPLRSPRATGEDPRVFAVAQGPVIVEGDARTGNPTSGVVKQGGLVELGIRQEIVTEQIWPMTMPASVNGSIVWGAAETRRMPTVVLNLKKPDIETASAVALAINSLFQNDPKVNVLPLEYILKNPLALVVDGGRVWVRLPGGEEMKSVGREAVDPKYDWEPTRFVAELMRAQVAPQRPRARVIINDATKTIAIVGNVNVKEGYVGIEGGRVLIPRTMPLSELMENQVNNAALTPQRRIDLIRALDGAGMIEGIVEGS